MAAIVYRLVEFFFANQGGTLPENFWKTFGFAVYNELPPTLFAGIMMYACSFLRKRFGEYLMYVYAFGYFLISFGLSSYFIEANTLLGSDLWAYSSDDILNTVSASSGFDWAWLALFVLPMLALYIVFQWVPQWGSKPSIVVLVVFVLTPVLTWIYPAPLDASNQIATNKLGYIIRSTKESKASLKNNSQDGMVLLEPPYLSLDSNSQSALTPYLVPNQDEGMPDIYVLVIEGLGTDFLNQGKFAGFMPFLDELSQRSLYWPNALSTTGRTFGVLPALLGSLPYSGNGFLSLGPYYPKHLSLSPLLKRNGYQSRFFHGGDLSFENQEMFLRYQGFDRIVQWGDFENENEVSRDQDGFSWGQPDHVLLEKHLKTITTENTPVFDVLLTISNHSPFQVPESRQFGIQNSLSQLQLDEEKMGLLDKFGDIFSTLHYVDQAIQDWFATMEQQGRLNNAVVMITGDHRIVPLPLGDNFERFNVPLIIYSPLQTSSQQFPNLVSHLDLMPSLVTWLHEHFDFLTPDTLFAMGKDLDVRKQLALDKSFAMMSHKGSLDQFIKDSLYMSRKQVYTINENLGFSKKDDPALNESMQKELNRYQASMDHWIKEELTAPSADWKLDTFLTLYTFSSTEMKTLKGLGVTEMAADSLFLYARDLAFKDRYAECRLAAKYLLNNSPNYTDALVLIGRTYAWDGEYEQAENFLRLAISQSPDYFDPYIALSDAQRWSGDQKAAIQTIEQGLLVMPEDENLINKLKQISE